MSPHASALVTFGMALLAVLVAAMLAFGYGAAGRARNEDAATRRRALLHAALVLTAWMALTGALAASGLLAQFDRRPPPSLILFASALVGAVALGLSRVGTRMGELPLVALVAAQSFRLPLELLLHQAAREGVMPNQMSFSGINFDIVSGATAILVAAAIGLGAPRAVVVAWNILGGALLVVIGAVAMLSMPALHHFGSAPAQLNTWVAYFPFVWLPTLLLAAALFGHVVLTRRLLR